MWAFNYDVRQILTACFIQSTSVIRKCDRRYYKVPQNLQNVIFITKWDVAPQSRQVCYHKILKHDKLYQRVFRKYFFHKILRKAVIFSEIQLNQKMTFAPTSKEYISDF